MNQTNQELQKAHQIVTHLLRTDTECRNNDNRLIYRAWSTQSPADLITLSNVHTLLPAESITRARREIQNEQGQYLPTRPAILIRRGIKETQIRQHYAHKPEIIQEWQEQTYQIK
jgi:hypothetical protein